MQTSMNKDFLSQDEGFIRLNTDKVKGNLLQILKPVILGGQRVVLQQGTEDVAAIIPIGEFERLEYLKDELKPGQYEPYEEAYYEDEGGIHCVFPDEVEAEFDEILQEVTLNDEIFGLLPTENLDDQDFDIFAPVVILMNIKHFWVPDYLISERNRLCMGKPNSLPSKITYP
jgi:hypothetical protein